MSKEEIKNLSIGIVSARFNNEIVEKISKACISKLQALGVTKINIIHKTVPGALEIPVTLQKMKESGTRIDVMIAIGLVIRGDTYHFEIVSNESASGILRARKQQKEPLKWH
jgi:6,7-dimethyl-8-ribityllumazine synthase